MSDESVTSDQSATSDDSAMYGSTHRGLQERFDTTQLADTMEAMIVSPTINDDQRQFIEARDYFYLSTVDGDGWPTVSYKGGPQGMLHVEDEQTVVFPSYDGNGMYLSLGNLAADERVGLLLMDFETPQRLRIQARASLDDAPERLALFPGAQTVVVLTVEKVFPNCARYIHPHTRVEASPYVPAEDGSQPIASWKRIDIMQPVLAATDREAIAGDTITGEEYSERLASGTS